MIKISEIASILKLSPFTAIIGFIIFIVFFSNVPNLINVNHLELALMDNRHKFFRSTARFIVLFLVILFSTILMANGFKWVPNLLNSGVSFISFLILITASTLKLIYKFKGDIPPTIGNFIENKRDNIAIVLTIILLISIACHSGYIVGNAEDKSVDDLSTHMEEGPRISTENNGVEIILKKDTVIALSFLYLSLYLSIWFTVIVSLMNYRAKLILFKIKDNNHEYCIDKVLFNGYVDMINMTSGARIPVSMDDIKNKEYRIE